MMFPYCSCMMELFSFGVSYFLSGLGIYLGEKHERQDRQVTKSPISRTAPGYFLLSLFPYLVGDLYCIVGA